MTPATPAKLQWNWIDPARAVRVAARESRKHHPAPAQHTMRFDRLHRIFGARRPIAARIPHPRRKHEAISTNHSDQYRLDHSNILNWTGPESLGPSSLSPSSAELQDDSTLPVTNCRHRHEPGAATASLQAADCAYRPTAS